MIRQIFRSITGCVLVAFIALSPVSLTAETLPAHRAHDFLDSMGIIAWIYDDARHTDIVVPRLEELGIKHLRAGLKAPNDNHRGKGAIQMQRLKEMGGKGYRITAMWHRWYDMETFLDISEKLLPDSLFQLEGPNEPWHQSENFQWRGDRWPKGAVNFMEDMHKALQSRPALRDIPVLSFSGSTSGYGSVEEWIDVANEHIYPENGNAITHNDQLAKLIERMRDTNYPTLPIQITETGYNSGGNGDKQTSSGVQARGVPRLFFETFRQGVKRTFLYSLYVEDDQGYAILERDGTPKSAFNALRDLRKIIADDGAAAASFKPEPIAVKIESKTPSVHHLLLQKSDGTYLLALWNDANMWDSSKKKAIENPEVPATLTFPATTSQLVLYRPLTHGTQPVQTLRPASSPLTLEVPDHILLVEMKPGS